MNDPDETFRPLVDVRFLGGFEVSCEGATLKRLPARATSILSYLLVNRSRPHTRDLLAGRFWSETSDDKARRQLSNVLWQIRKAMSEAEIPEIIFADRSRVGIADDVEIVVDAEEYEAQLDAVISDMADIPQAHQISRLTMAVDAYSGDFLSGYYEDWMASERRRLRNRQADALGRLTTLYRGASDFKAALRSAEQLVELDSLREESHREVMRLHGILGNSAAAERQYEQCRRILDRELGVDPSEETTMLLETIRSDVSGLSSAGHRGVVNEDHRMVGRVKERADLAQLLNGLSVGRGGFVLIEGEPGIGKSRLVEDMLERASFLGLRALTASHSTVSTGEPYHAFREMLTPVLIGLRAEHVAESVAPVWLRQASDLLPGLQPYVADSQPNHPLHPGEETARTSEALAQVLLTQGAAKPTLMVFEDVHWADSDSMLVFSALSARLATSGVLAVLTYRRFEAQQSSAVWSTITDLEASGSSTVVQLGPLTDIESQELVANSDMNAVWSDYRDRDRIVVGSGGNPLYLLEALRDPGILSSEWSDDVSENSEESEYPVTLRLAIQDRLADLSDDARLVLGTLAVLAEGTSGGLIREITGLTRAAALVALDLIVDRNFVTESDLGDYRFSHDQTRRVVLALLDDEQVIDSHRRTFVALEGEEDPKADRLAYHARRGDLWGEAHRWYTVAARQAVEVNAFAVAAGHFEFADEAAENAGLGPESRLKELLEFEQVLDVTGNRIAQEDLLKRLADVDLAPEDALKVRERQAWLLLLTDEMTEARRSAEAWVDWAADCGLSTHGLLMVLGEARYRSGDSTGAAESLRMALSAAKADGATSAVVSASSYLARVLVDRADGSEAEQLLEDAMELAVELNDVRSQIDILSIQFFAAHAAGNHDVAVGYLEKTLSQSRSVGYRVGEVRNLINLGSFHTAHGQAGRALMLFKEAAEVATSLGDHRFEAFVRLNLAELNHRLLGEDVEAAQLARAASRYFRSVGDHRRETLAMCKLCRIDWRAGRRRLAKTRLRHLIETSAAADEAVAEVAGRRIAAEFAVEVEDYRTAAEELDIALVRCSEQWIRPAIMAERALVATYIDETDLALEMATEALLSIDGESEFAFVTAWQCGRALTRIGHQEMASRQFQAAYELLESNLSGLSEEQRSQAWRIPELAAIAESFERVSPRSVTEQLPADDAPLGRPLQEFEYVPVNLTVSDPSDWEIASRAERRQQRILRMSAEAEVVGAAIRVGDLARLLNVSERTAKRDLKELRNRGESPRTRRNN